MRWVEFYCPFASEASLCEIIPDERLFDQFASRGSSCGARLAQVKENSTSHPSFSGFTRPTWSHMYTTSHSYRDAESFGLLWFLHRIVQSTIHKEGSRMVLQKRTEDSKGRITGIIFGVVVGLSVILLRRAFILGLFSFSFMTSSMHSSNCLTFSTKFNPFFSRKGPPPRTPC